MARDGGRGRGDWKARRDSRDTGPYAEGSGSDTGPVDIVAVRRDDALIDAIASEGPVQTESAEETQLAALLADWRAEIIAPPLPDAPDLDTVVAAVNQEIGARQARISARTGGRLRLLRPIAGAAAAVALVAGGMTAFSYAAEPGDPLWRVKEVVFSEQAQSTVVQRADDDMAAAQTLIEQGNPEQARARLEQASTNATQVDDPAKRDVLLERWQQLLAELRRISPEAAQQLEHAVPPPGSQQQTSTSPPSVSETTRPSPSESTVPSIMGVEPSTPGGNQPTGQPGVPGVPDTQEPVDQPPVTEEPGTPTESPEPTEPTAAPTTLPTSPPVTPSSVATLPIPVFPPETDTGGQSPDTGGQSSPSTVDQSPATPTGTTGSN
ncbi:hypothetical protein B0T36_13610 [Nocardia donostiensis]|uniref:anti-sigma-D factor RsdA n=1 Tax=Nocardia donostiensis TaxID=1538463 RepID=UPI0009DA019D|nr:anti-sigma-D factor RsdA [Nocardia donostiensis]OQS14553.1 hypothetical protein B0T36_13610 [Nocardia donostiensis]